MSEELVSCDKFILHRWQLAAPRPIGGDNRCYLVCVIDGQLFIADDPANEPLCRGQTALIPATSPALLSPQGSATVLVAALPD